MASVGACSLTTDLKGFSGGDGGDGSSSSGGVEAGSIDASTSSGADGSPNDASPSDVDAGSTCANATLCDGFERTAPRGAWPDESTVLGGGLSTTAEEPHSGNRALRLGLSDKQGASAMLIYRMPTASVIEYQYWFRVKDEIKQTNFFGLNFQTDTEERAFFMVLKEGTMLYAEQYFLNGSPKSYSESEPFDVPINQWINVAVFFDRDKHSISVMVDGKLLIDGYSVTGLPTEKAELHAGVSYTVAGPAFQLDVDDVRFAYEP